MTRYNAELITEGGYEVKIQLGRAKYIVVFSRSPLYFYGLLDSDFHEDSAGEMYVRL